MASKKVTFPNGKETTVYSVPQKFYDEIRLAFPYPPVPVLEDNRTATGEPMRFENRDDPDYKAACQEIEEKRNTKWLERMTLRGLRDVRPPDGWRISDEQIAEARYFTENPAWQPRQGEIGRILDYIEYEFFESPEDRTFLLKTINDLSGLSLDREAEAADAIEATFRGDVEISGEGEEEARDSD